MSSSSGSKRSKFWKNAFKPKKTSAGTDSSTGDHVSRLQENDKNANTLGLSTVFQPLDGTKVIADVVFLHGLTGGSFSTWYNEQHHVTWPRDFLGQDLKKVRIFTFGYDADVANWWNPASQNRIGNHAETLNGALDRERRRTNTLRRKLIFVAHSLGGLVVKNALTLSKHSPDKHLHSIEASTFGIAFIGTPHFGSDLAHWGAYATNIAKVMTSANKEIVSVLRPESEMLSAIQKDFGGLLRTRAEDGNPLSITCFFEEHRVKIIGEIVPKRSAIIQGYSSYGIHGNHMTMTRFPHRSDNGYQTVLGELERWVEELTEITIPSDEDTRLKIKHFSKIVYGAYIFPVLVKGKNRYTLLMKIRSNGFGETISNSKNG